MANFEKVAGVIFDELLGGSEVEVLTKNVTVASGQKVARGALLAETADKCSVAGKTDKAVYVAAETVDAANGDTVATVYTTGLFNREKLSVADGDTVNAHEAELRTVGIHLTALH